MAEIVIHYDRIPDLLANERLRDQVVDIMMKERANGESPVYSVKMLLMVFDQILTVENPRRDPSPEAFMSHVHEHRHYLIDLINRLLPDDLQVQIE